MTERLAETDAHEGPVYVAAERALYFTTQRAGRRVDIKRRSLADGRISTVLADAAAANGMSLGHDRSANYDAVPRVVFTDPQAASVGQGEGALTATVALAEVPRTSTYTRAYADRPGFMTLISDGEQVTGAYAVGPEAGEWLQQATLAIRARVPLAVIDDVIQPFPTFSEAFLHALQELTARQPAAA